jgi:prepilin-type N-terminal cleavage/methylation domain-containing protein
MPTREWRADSPRGYSLVEVMLVLAIAGVLSGMAAIQMGSSKDAGRADGAMRVVLSQLNQARELAITQRRYMRVTFDVTNTQLSVIREDTSTTTTTLSTVPFEGGVKYQLISAAGIGITTDTPDSFGMSAPVSFIAAGVTSLSATGTSTVAKFTPDGTLVDWNGQTANMSIFVAMPNNPRTARAVTVLGATGRIRAYGWTGKLWKAA